MVIFVARRKCRNSSAWPGRPCHDRGHRSPPWAHLPTPSPAEREQHVLGAWARKEKFFSFSEGRPWLFPREGGVDLPVCASALLEQDNEAGLLKVMVSRQSLVHAVLPHDDEGNAVGE